LGLHAVETGSCLAEKLLNRTALHFHRLKGGLPSTPQSAAEVD
jgi:hypothetical protein